MFCRPEEIKVIGRVKTPTTRSPSPQQKHKTTQDRAVTLVVSKQGIEVKDEGSRLSDGDAKLIPYKSNKMNWLCFGCYLCHLIYQFCDLPLSLNKLCHENNNNRTK